jgi:hypothetical protein
MTPGTRPVPPQPVRCSGCDRSRKSLPTGCPEPKARSHRFGLQIALGGLLRRRQAEEQIAKKGDHMYKGWS